MSDSNEKAKDLEEAYGLEDGGPDPEELREVREEMTKEVAGHIQKVVNLNILKWVHENRGLVADEGGDKILNEFFTAVDFGDFGRAQEILGDAGLAVKMEHYRGMQILYLTYRDDPVEILWPDADVDSSEELEQKIDDILAHPGEHHEECPECGCRQLDTLREAKDEPQDICLNPDCDWVEEERSHAG